MDTHAAALEGSVLESSSSRRWRVVGLLVLAVVATALVQSLWPGRRILPVSNTDPVAFLAVFFCAFLCEYIDSALGMGYGTTLTPLLVLIGFNVRDVVPCILLSEMITGVGAGLMHHHDRNIHLLQDREVRTALVPLALLSGIGAAIAACIAMKVSGPVLKGAVGVIVVSTGIITILSAKRDLTFNLRQLLAYGSLAAFNKGLSGGGYGPLVTAGQVVSGVPPKKAVAITSLAESVTCIIGLAAYLLLGNAPTASLALPLTLGAVLSVPLATFTVRRIPENAMRSLVGIVACVLGALMLAKLLPL